MTNYNKGNEYEDFVTQVYKAILDAQVFGLQPGVGPASYIDRLSLDATLSKLVERKQQHVASPAVP